MTNNTVITLFAVVAMFLISSTADAQILSIGTRVLRDDIPATIQQTSVGLTHSLSNTFITHTEYSFVFADQNEFHGLPRLRPSIHRIEQGIEARVASTGLGFAVKGALSRIHTGKVLGDFGLTAQYGFSWYAIANEAPVRFSFRAEAGRSRDVSVSTAMHENVLFQHAQAQLECDIAEEIQLVGNATREWYHDGNRRDVAYIYSLVHPLSKPRISIGYAYSWADSERSTWRMTASTFDPIQREYSYSYFYYPYFTPLKERGHQVLGIVQWWIIPDILLTAKATVPVWSRGRMKYMPDSGPWPAPLDFDLTYEVEDILPQQYEAGLLIRLATHMLAGIGVEYFKKPYYEYLQGRLVLQYTFD